MATDRTPKLTPKIRELVAADRNARPPVGRLTPAHVDALVAVATRRQEFAEPVVASRAIQALAAGARADVSVPVLGEIVSDRKAPTTDRVVAARELGRIASPEAEAALVGRMRDRDPRVRQAVFAGLGTFAGPPVLRRLTKLAEPDDVATERQLALTRALIAHRHGLDGPFLPEVQARKRRRGRPEQMLSLTLRTKTAKATAADRQRLLGPTYGVDLADRSYALMCGRAEWTVFVNQEVGESVTVLDHLVERPWIAAILARWFPERIATTTQYLLLTRPVDGAAHIDVVRADGEVLYTGSARHAGAALAFSITDVDRPGTARTHVAGRVTSKGIELDVADTFATRTATLSTEPVVVP